MELIRPFARLNKGDAGIAGGKGASLGEMTQAGIPVPPGYVILTHAFERFLEEADLNQELDAVLDNVNREEMRSVDQASERIQQLIHAAKMPEDIAAEIRAHFDVLDARYVAVRSSATAEDGASAAWAGQLDTYLNTTTDELLTNVQRCWASLFTPRAIFYRFEKGMHGTKISVAVVVQKMIQSEVSGIAFSVHPVTEDYNQLIIEGGFGLGEAIVSGQVTPDSFVVEKQPRRIIDKNITFQSRALWRAASSGNEWRELSQEEGNKPALSDEQVMGLAEIVLHIERHYGFPCDIEWAFEAGSFFITQSRPITTLSKSGKGTAAKVPERWHYWGQWKSPLLVNSPYSCFVESRIVREWPLLQKVKGDQVTYAGNFFTLTSDLDCIRTEVIAALEGTGDFFRILEQHCLQEEKDLLALEGGQDLETFFTHMENIIGCSMTAQYVAQISKEYLKKKCAEFGIEESNVMAAMQLPGKTRYEQYENELQNLRNEDIQDFVKKYAWISTYVYEGEPLSEDAVRKEMARLDAASHKAEPTEVPPGFKSFVDGASTCAYWRTRNAETMNKVAFSYRPCLQEFAAAHNIPYEKVIQMTHREIVDVLRGAPMPSNVLARSAMWGMEYEDGVLNVISEEAAADKLTHMPMPKVKSESEVEGLIAYKGKVQGVARIVLTYQEIAKVQQGDIIIANETTPDYIGAMKLAAAFVTNQGGITSHAAIIAREMRKPCIVGTAVATRVFKDGDMVEVDADEGVVRLIRSNADTPRVLTKIFERERPLMYMMLWHESDRDGLARFTKQSTTNTMQIVPPQGQRGSVWYGESDLVELEAEALRQINGDDALRKDMVSHTESQWEKVAPYLRYEKKPQSVAEFKDLYDDLCSFWHAMNSVYFRLPDHADLNSEFRKNMADIRDKTQEYSPNMPIVLQRAIEELLSEYARFTHIIAPEEAVRLAQKKDDALIAELETRKKEGAFILEGRIYPMASLSEELRRRNFVLEKADLNTKEITGSVAYKGYAKGIVRVITRREQLGSVQDGEILVAALTEPDYVPAMQRAAAFVTDEGGIMSHTAIIAREMKKPCVIGTKIATQVLKDGDMVEVDADKGIVRKLDTSHGPELTFQWASGGISILMSSTLRDPRSFGAIEYVYLTEKNLNRSYLKGNGVRDYYEWGKKLLEPTYVKNIEAQADVIAEKLIAYKCETLSEKNSLTEWGRLTELWAELWIPYVYCNEFIQRPLEDVLLKELPAEKIVDAIHGVNSQPLTASAQHALDALRSLGAIKLHLHEKLVSLLAGYDVFANYFQNVYGLSRERFFALTHDEVRSAMQGETIPIEQADKRLAGCAMVKEGTRWEFLTGQEFQMWKARIDATEPSNIQGIVAYKGLAKGRVVIHMDWNGVREVPLGSILVTGMTNPQMVPYLKNVAAIVTDEGGLACHAAIISREMKIPCIVGTKVASRLLKDGDVVEVDAENGIVRKI